MPHMATPCHLWTASRFQKARTGTLTYGCFGLGGKNRGAHRVAFELSAGRQPTGCVLHRCDNAVCVNPEHLFEGTVQDNNNDRKSRGRYGKKLTPVLVQEMRSRHIGGEGSRRLSRAFGVNRRTVLDIIRRRLWREVA